MGLLDALLSSWLSISVLVLVVVLVALYAAFTSRRRTGEPPLVGGNIPWLGVGVEFGTVGFNGLLNKYTKQLGDVFTMFLGGKRMTFITNTHMMSDIIKLEAKGTLDPYELRIFNLPPVFGFTPYRQKFITEYWQSPQDARDMTFFQGKHLLPLTMRFQTEFSQRLVELVPKAEWKEGELFDLIFHLFVPAATSIFYGDNAYWQSEQFMKDLLTLNSGFENTMRGVEFNSVPAIVEAKKRLAKHLLLGPTASSEEAVKNFYAHWEEAGILPGEMETNFMSLLWATNMNTTISAFWAIYYVLHDPAAMKAISEEISTLVTSEQVEITPQGTYKFTYDQIQKLNYAESAVYEAMRMVSASLVQKIATEDFVLETYKGNFNIRKGDWVFFSTYQAHMDPDLYASPGVFKFDRFKKDPETGRQPTFVKDGIKANTTILAFSEGKHKCPGRFFAMNELRMLFLFLFTQLDIDFVDGKKPEPDLRYFGVGAMRPVGDLKIRYRLKSK